MGVILEINEENLIKQIKIIRNEIGHENSEINIKEIIYNKTNKKLLIITPDRPDKSVIIGKGGWVVGKLKEKLQLNNIHVEAYTDIMVQKYRIETLTKQIDVPQEYLNVNSNKIIEDSLNGKYHPCGRCSKVINKTIEDYAIKNNIHIIISGDLLTTGSQSITVHDNFIKLNLPALLNVSKQELEKITNEYNIKKSKTFGCPLLSETIKKYPYMKKYSIQRILRETRAGALEPGQALEQIQSLILKK